MERQTEIQALENVRSRLAARERLARLRDHPGSLGTSAE